MFLSTNMKLVSRNEMSLVVGNRFSTLEISLSVLKFLRETILLDMGLSILIINLIAVKLLSEMQYFLSWANQHWK